MLAEDGQYFHTMVAKLLFPSKRVRPDIQEAIAFLTTWVKKPDVDDYKKLGRVVKYLRSNPHLALEADNTMVIKWWIDAAFAVHSDTRSQTGATMTLGKGSAYSMSTRQRLKCKEFNWGWISWSGQRYADGAVDAALPGSTRIWGDKQQGIPGQHELDVIGKERACFQWEEDQTHQHTILLCGWPRQSPRSKHWTLSHGRDGGRLLH